MAGPGLFAQEITSASPYAQRRHRGLDAERKLPMVPLELADVADDAAEPGAQQARLGMEHEPPWGAGIGGDVLGMGIASRHHRRVSAEQNGQELAKALLAP